jgi:hypothetical protein
MWEEGLLGSMHRLVIEPDFFFIQGTLKVPVLKPAPISFHISAASVVPIGKTGTYLCFL